MLLSFTCLCGGCNAVASVDLERSQALPPGGVQGFYISHPVRSGVQTWTFAKTACSVFSRIHTGELSITLRCSTGAVTGIDFHN